MTTGRVVSPWRSCPRPCRPVAFRTAADRGPRGEPVEVPAQRPGDQVADVEPGAGRHRHGGHVEGIDQDARRQPPAW